MTLTDEKLARLRELVAADLDADTDYLASSDCLRDALAALDELASLRVENAKLLPYATARCQCIITRLAGTESDRWQNAVVNGMAVKTLDLKRVGRIELKEGSDAAYARGRADERADVVRWLWRLDGEAAGEVERGEHVAKEGV